MNSNTYQSIKLNNIKIHHSFQQTYIIINHKMKIYLLILFVFALTSTTIKSLRVDPQSSLFIDQYNRTTIFHGVNTVYKTFPFYPDTQTFSTNYSLTDIDLYNLKHWGFNHIRLHVAWQGVEPEKGQYNYSYVQKLTQIVRKCNKFGIQVLLDAHQDLFNKNFCGEGFPQWTGNRSSFPKPLKVNLTYDEKGYPLRQDCLKVPFSEFYLSYDLMKFQEDFFTNQRGLLDHFCKMWEIVATYMSNEPNIIGYEILNEPIGANAYKNPADVLQPGVSNNKFMLSAYKRIYKTIRSVDPKTLVFFEPSVLDFLSQGFFETPGGEEESAKQVFSYHVYCPLVNPLGEPISTEFCKYFDQMEVTSKQANIQHMKIGGFMTEYGALSNSVKSAKQITILTDLMQEYFRSWTYWQFKYYNDVTTMARPATTESFYNMDGSLQETKVRALARPYAYAICGKPIKESLKNGVFSLKYFAERICYNKNTEVFLSEAFYYPVGFDVKFSESCKDCKLRLLNGESSSFYEVIVPDNVSNRTIELIVTSKKNQLQ